MNKPNRISCIYNTLLAIHVHVNVYRKEGLKPGEYHQIERYLTQSPSEESQRTTSLLETLQGICISVKLSILKITNFTIGMLRNRLHGRASQTLVGLGRLLKRLSTPEGLVGRLHLQQALRAFHISLTPEVTLIDDVIITTFDIGL